MKIAFPIKENMGMDSPVYGHFGSAPYFIIVDIESGEYESVVNPSRDHLHGQCEPLAAFSGKNIDAVTSGGMGAGALMKLSTAGIKAFHAVEGTVSENLELVKSGILPLFAENQTCAGHDNHENCAH